MHMRDWVLVPSLVPTMFGLATNIVCVCMCVVFFFLAVGGAIHCPQQNGGEAKVP